jgi:hypothetical protein
MPDAFDPYFEWLDIESTGLPPDYYRLLGLPQFESDAELIGPAADAAMVRVRRFRPGPHLAEWSRLLDELAAAKECLLDLAKKRTYDRSLAQGSLDDKPAPQEEETEQAVTGQSPISVPPEPIGKSTVASFAIGRAIAGVIAMATIAVVVLIYTLHQRATPPNPSDAAHEAQATPIVASKSPELTNRALPNPPPAETPKPKPPEPAKEPVKAPAPTEVPQPNAKPAETAKTPSQPEPPKPAIDAKRTAEFARAVADARAAFSARKLPVAAVHIKAAATKAQTPEDHQQVDRLETMQKHLNQFWNGIRTAMAKLQPAEEIAIADTRMIVVESERDRLTVKMEGGLQHYRAVTMPTPLILALVDQYFGKDAGSKAIIGTFLAVDPEGDRSLARQYWQEAAQADIDCEKLLPELDEGRGAKGERRKATSKESSDLPSPASGGQHGVVGVGGEGG